MTGWWAIPCHDASARVMQEHLPGDVTLDKSLRTVKDAKGYSWQAIAFKMTHDGNSNGPYLRLVGFPGAIAIDRTHPLIITTPSGQTFTLDDQSFLIFKNGASPQPHVAQYDLSNVLGQLRTSTRLRLTLPVLDGGVGDPSILMSSRGESPPPVLAPLELSIPKSMVDEWLLVAQQSESM
jgi:hypothetical protein